MADPKSDSKFDSKSDLTADPDAAVAPRAAAPASRSSAPGRLARLRRAGEPVLRRVLHLWWRLSRGLTLGVRALVIDPEGRVFLVRHSYVSGWYLPGGGVEIGETLGEALVRELSEEGNLHLTGAATLHGVYLNARVSRRDHVALFVVRDFVQPAPPRPNREIVAAGFFPVDALPADTTRGTRARLAEVLGGAPVTEHW
ncbi:MAG: NUDIX domain-containing protein [Rhodovulum sp.]|nr:NUDIX domain-containing protein [Rhodovulum sp.]